MVGVRAGKDRQDSAGQDKTGQDKIGPKAQRERTGSVGNKATVGKVGGNIVCPCSLRLA